MMSRRRTLAFARWLAICIIVSLAGACGGGGGSGRAAAAPITTNDPTTSAEPQVVNTFAYQASSPYADVLRSCAYAGDATQACRLSTLPFLGQDTATPTIDDVLQRVLVSHSWMGDNLRTLLEQLPSDMLLMLRSITSVVIASDIRPAFYDPATGAIYLDSDFVWLTESQQSVVTQEEDFRTNFGDPLQFSMPWRYVRDNERLTVSVNPDGSRDPSSLLPILGFLLYHELAHAVDFMPQAKMVDLATTLSAEEAIVSGVFLSSSWRAQNDLESQELVNLALVSFRGETPTQDQQDLLPDDLVSEFANEGAIQYYSYSNQFEDLATMFETVMMMFHFDFEKDTGITDNTEFSNDGIVAWGQRGRLSDQFAYGRAVAAVQTLYPGDPTAVESFLAALPAPIEMAPSTTWGDNLQIGSQTNADTEQLDKRTQDDILERRRIR
jgi:hypothetical protein